MSPQTLAMADQDAVQRLARWLRRHGQSVRMPPKRTALMLRQRRAIAVARACRAHGGTGDI